MHYFCNMKFEYDENKSNSNLTKHGIDFRQSQLLWNDPNLLTFKSKYIDEIRYLHIGIIKKTHWSAITTIRDEKIRIISVRRARINEIELYEN